MQISLSFGNKDCFFKGHLSEIKGHLGEVVKESRKNDLGESIEIEEKTCINLHLNSFFVSVDVSETIQPHFL